VLTHSQLADRLRDAAHPVLMIDIAVPRNIDPALDELPNVYVYNIDDLDRLVSRNLERRRREVPRARAVVQAEVEQFDRWLQSLDVVPTIKGLIQHFGDVRQEAVEQFGKYFADSEQEELEKFADSLCKKILHQPISYLRAAANNGGTDTDRLAAVEMIRRIFDLDPVEKTE
jgi:glutamyl-tRNA reductase